MFVTRWRPGPAVASALLLILPACAKPLNRAEISEAQPVSDWEGLNKLYHAGKIYFGGQPTEGAIRSAPEHGIKVVVNLRSNEEMEGVDFDEAKLVEALGMRYVSIPITPPTFDAPDADRLKEVLTETPGPVLIHCKSSNRVGALWALYLARHRGVAVDDAIRYGQSAGLRSHGLEESIRKLATP